MGRRVDNVSIGLTVHQLACRYRQLASHALLGTYSQGSICSI